MTNLETVEDKKTWEPIPLRIEVEVERAGKKELQQWSIQLPQRVKDLDEVQFMSLAEWYFMPVFKEEFSYKFLQLLLKMDDADYTAIDDETMLALRPLINPFVLNMPVCFVSLFSKFEDYSGPTNGMANMILDEKIFADKLLSRYLKNRQLKDINALVGLLYRKEGEHFSDWQKDSDFFTDRMSDEKVKHKYAAVLNYMCLRNSLPHRFPKVFNHSGGVGKEPDWRKVTVQLAGDKFGKPTEVRLASVLDVLTYMESLMDN